MPGPGTPPRWRGGEPRVSGIHVCGVPNKPQMAGTRVAMTFNVSISPLVAALAALLLVLTVPPALFLVNVSLHETQLDGSLGEFTLRFYEQLFSGRFFLPSLRNTLLYAFGSAAIAIAVGTVQALIVERTNTPGRRLAFFAAIISLGVPHVLYALAWLLLLGRSGPVNDAIMAVFQREQAIDGYAIDV